MHLGVREHATKISEEPAPTLPRTTGSVANQCKQALSISYGSIVQQLLHNCNLRSTANCPTSCWTIARCVEERVYGWLTATIRRVARSSLRKTSRAATEDRSSGRHLTMVQNQDRRIRPHERTTCPAKHLLRLRQCYCFTTRSRWRNFPMLTLSTYKPAARCCTSISAIAPP